MNDPALDGIDDATLNHPGICSATQCPAQSAGHADGGYRFDGVDDLIRIPSHADFSSTTGFAMSMWMRPAVVTARSCLVGKPLGVQFEDSYELCVDPDLSLFYFSCTSANCNGLSSLPGMVVSNAWQHVAITFDGTTKRMYVGSDEVGNATPAFVEYDDNELLIGGDIDRGVPVAFFNGDIDELRIYTRSLAPAEIAALAND